METKTFISNITYDQLFEIAKTVKSINTCTHPSILILKCQFRLIVIYVPHSYAKSYQYKLCLQALMITKAMPLF